MDSQRYWFEEVPEDRRYWFLVPWGPSPREEAEREDSEFPPELQTELRDIEAEVRSERVFGTTGPEARASRRRIKDLRKRMEDVGYGANAFSVPWWLEIQPKWEHRQEIEYVQAPMLFSTREEAEKQRRDIENTEPESYLHLVEQFGEELTDEAFDNTSPLRVMWIDLDTLLDKLEDSDFLCVMVDHKLKLRQDFVEEVKRQLEEPEE